jgi:selenium-binding protein 1
MPNVGDELHHYGWNRCSSACHGPDRSYLIVPGFRARALMRGSWGGGSNR